MTKEVEEVQFNISNINLIKDVKSSIIFKKIFSFLNINIKLQTIIYNKSYQKKLDININDYIQTSGKYITVLNGKQTVMSIEGNIKLFEGEYLNGKKVGKGKEYYYNGTLKFEGEYLNGKRNGKGKEYDVKGALQFDGEYLNDKRWKGKVEEYNYFGCLLLKGQYLDGKINGNIFQYFANSKLKYEGNYKNGKVDNFERFYNEAGNLTSEIIYENDKIKKELKKEYHHTGNLIYESEALYGQIIKEKFYNKKGKLKMDIEYLNNTNLWKTKEYQDDELVFEGECKNGEKGLIRWNGDGKEYRRIGCNNILIFEGEYFEGKRWNGKGKEYNDINELEFDGEYINGKKIRKGKEYNAEGGLIFEGEYLYEIKLKGKEYNKDGKIVFEGEYSDGKRWNGKGKEYDNEGNLIFDGMYTYGTKNGRMKKYKDNKLQFEGEVVFNKLKGKGKKYYKNGNLKFEGRYYDCKREGNGKDYYKSGKLKYEAEYSNGKRNGYGKQYYLNGKIKFEGEYLNGKEWNGIRYDNNGLIEFEVIYGKKKIKE